MSPTAFVWGWKIWTTVQPWRRLKKARNKWRAKKGKPLLSITAEDDNVLPKGTQTYTGIAVLLLTPLVAKYGVGTEELTMWVTAVGTIVGGIVAILGRMRATKVTE